MKGAIQFTTLERQGESLAEYSQKLSFSDRLNLCFKLTENAFWRELQNLNEKRSKKVKVFKALENESLEDFFKRIKG